MNSSEKNGCHFCGESVNEEFTFCPYCGERADGSFKCQSCSSYVPKDAAFCPACGERYDGKKVCKKCDCLGEKNAVFCFNCGAPYGNESDLSLKTDFNKEKVKDKAANRKLISTHTFSLAVRGLCLIFSIIIFIFSFLQVYTYKNPIDLQIRNIDNVTFMFDLAYDFENAHNSKLHDRFETLTERIDAEHGKFVKNNPNAYEEDFLEIPKYEKLVKKAYLLTMRLNYQATDVSANQDLAASVIIRGILSLLYIIVAGISMIVNVYAFVLLLLKKEPKRVNIINYLTLLPILFMIPLMCIVPSSTKVAGLLIIAFCFNVFLAGLIAVAKWYEQGFPSKRVLIKKAVSTVVVFILLGVSFTGLFSGEAKLTAANRYSSRRYTYSYDISHLESEFMSEDRHDGTLLDTITIRNFVESKTKSLEGLQHSMLAKEDYIRSHFSIGKFLISGYLYDFYLFIPTLYFSLLCFYLLLGIMLYFHLVSFFHSDVRERKSVLLTRILLSIASVVGLVLTIILIVFLNNALYFTQTLSYKIGPGSILMVIFSLSSLIISLIFRRNKIGNDERRLAKSK